MKIALCQINPIVGSIDSNVEKILEFYSSEINKKHYDKMFSNNEVKNNIDFTRRPETLSPQEFAHLVKSLK